MQGVADAIGHDGADERGGGGGGDGWLRDVEKDEPARGNDQKGGLGARESRGNGVPGSHDSRGVSNISVTRLAPESSTPPSKVFITCQRCCTSRSPTRSPPWHSSSSTRPLGSPTHDEELSESHAAHLANPERCSEPIRTWAGLAGHRAAWSWCAEDGIILRGDELEEVFVADEWDRTPAPATPKLSYQDILELKQLRISLHTLRPTNLSPAVHHVGSLILFIILLPASSSNTASPSPLRSRTRALQRVPLTLQLAGKIAKNSLRPKSTLRSCPI
ncbi:hypothetical protein A0H81_05998 [Grifola frondosa]|uniref:Uncharacterized protein n=1 Tax=Grifola frondosa TaxID=5627 RepID=A0A1C7M9J0_GRIFR|nr:hypothetical protein A0H81_05998 [Grifola frondosa]